MAVGGERLKVISIVGPGRTGSTLLAALLGEMPGFVNVGELRWLWRHGVLEGRPCGCGCPAVQCPLWAQVLKQVLGELPCNGSTQADAAVLAIVASQREVAARRNRLAAIRSADRARTDWSAVTHLRAVAEDLAQAVRSATGCRVLVDASKRPHDAALFAAADSLDHYVVHLVRDPRAVAYSWQRTKQMPKSAAGPEQMARRSLSSSAGRWAENNLGSELLRRHVPRDRWMFMRYEDLVAAPEDRLAELMSFVGESAELPFEGPDVVRLHTNHSVAGNPIRFHTGPVTIRPDNEWARVMSDRQTAAVTALTLPLMLRYGYSPLVRSA